MAKLIAEIMKGLEALTVADLEALPPIERQRLADLLRHWAAIAERPDPPKGPLADIGPREG